MCGCFNNSSRNINSDNDLYSLSINQNSNCGCNSSPRCLRDLLANNIGNRCTCEFQNANNVVRRTGILAEVGNDYLRLRSLNNFNSITSPLSTLLSVQFN